MTESSEQHCSVEGCKRPYRAKGFCNTHFKKWRDGEMPQKSRYKICGEEKCRQPMFRHGKCEEHYNAVIGKAAPAAETTAPTTAAAAAPKTEIAPAETPKEETKAE